MATTSDISKGVFIRVNGELGQVIDYDYVTPNKTGAMYHVKLRNVRTGKAIQVRYWSGDPIDLVRVEVREMQYIYREGTALACMDNESYEQVLIDETLLGESLRFLKEGMILQISFDSNETPIFAELPYFVELEVTYTEPGLKGDTATNASKPATLETGAEIRVPLFVNLGDKLKIDTRDGSYVERVK
jgi:elongation factor P